MLMIITLHFLGKGGVLASPIMGHRYDLAWIIESICIVAVNCYVLISGYFLINSKFKFSKLLQLLAQVLFYSLFVTLLLVVSGKVEINASTVITTLFPTLTGQYWFITAYVGMYILSPFLNILIDNLRRTQHLWLCAVGILLFSVWPSLFWKSDVAYHIQNGYSVVWFVVLYLVAAYLKKYYTPDHKLSRHLTRYGIIAAACTLLTVGLSYGYYKTGLIDFQSLKDSLFAYNSVTTLVASVALFMVFVNLRINNKGLNKGIALLAPLTFGVYLLHEHPLLRTWLWGDIFSATTIDDHHLTIFGLIVVPAVYLIGSSVDYLRARLFLMVGNWPAFSNAYTAFETRIMRLAEAIVK